MDIARNATRINASRPGNNKARDCYTLLPNSAAWCCGIGRRVAQDERQGLGSAIRQGRFFAFSQPKP